MSGSPQAQIIPYGVDPVRVLAEQLLEHHSNQQYRFDQITVLFPNTACVPRFRRVLLECANARGQAAVIPPWTGTLHLWTTRHFPPERKILSAHARELLLYEAMAGLRNIEPTQRWTLCEALIKTFDELATSDHQLSGELDQLRAQLASGYGVGTSAYRQLDAEARLVHELWVRWRDQLQASDELDPTLAYANALQASLARLETSAPIYLVGFIRLRDVERRWLNAALTRGVARLLVQGQPAAEPSAPGTLLQQMLTGLNLPAQSPKSGSQCGEFLDQVFDDALDMRTRAMKFAARVPDDPVIGRVATYCAADAEHEAHAIDVQTRRWWLAGKRNIGIVTNDRRLARRVRALLERANIQVQDAAGWRLSTTSAASALAGWLDAVESNFRFQPLLEFLKSPFILFPPQARDRDAWLPYFERDVVNGLSITADIHRYRRASAQEWAAATSDAEQGRHATVNVVLDWLARAAQRLRPLSMQGQHPPAEYLVALRDSLEILGLHDQYQGDAAGRSLIELLAALSDASEDRSVRLDWANFRRWLARHLERHNFQPPLGGRGVELMGLAESRLYRFDALILAGATADHLPGSGAYLPLLNDRVRHQLALPLTRVARDELLYDFRRLLEAAPEVLLTWRREDRGEPVLASPWVERLQAFHTLGYETSLDDTALANLVIEPATRLAATDPQPTTTRVSRPRPAVSRDLMPARISASSYQRLLDCPFQFYARDCLGLLPTAVMRDEVDKQTAGRHIHRVLQAFHGKTAGLPGPWVEPVTNANQTEAAALMREISATVFAADISGEFTARGWLYRWQASIEPYTDWLRDWGRDHRVEATEVMCETTLAGQPGILLIGRLDRVDSGTDGDVIVDYKTGALPRVADVSDGEQIQLPFYVLLWPAGVAEVQYLQIDRDRVRSYAEIRGPALAALRDAVGTRLASLIDALRAGSSLPAWGDNTVCARCDFAGICRKQHWEEGVEIAAGK